VPNNSKLQVTGVASGRMV